MLVGNKLDLESSRKVPKELAQEYAEEEGLLFAEASAKNGDGVEQLFLDIGESISSSLLVQSLQSSQEASSQCTAKARSSSCKGSERFWSIGRNAFCL